MITSLSSNYKPLSEVHQPDNFTSTSESAYSSTTTTTNHELTKISVISPQHHLMDTVVVHHQPDCHVLAQHKLAGAGGELFSARRAWRGEIVWTNFHCLLCLGLTGFFLFWTAILLRMYLPTDSALMDWWLRPEGEVNL